MPALPRSLTFWRLAWVLVIHSFVASWAHATALPAWDIEQLTRVSDIVVRGSVSQQTQGVLFGKQVTRTVVEVEQILHRNDARVPKGPLNRLTLTQWGGRSRTISSQIAGDATLKPGEAVLLFAFRGPQDEPAEGDRRGGPVYFITQLGVGVFTVAPDGAFEQVVDADLISPSDGTFIPRPATRRFEFDAAISAIDTGKRPPETPADPVAATPIERDNSGAPQALTLEQIRAAQGAERAPPRPPPGPALPPTPPPPAD